MHTFYIPSIGDKVILCEDFAFTLYAEHRNKSLVAALGLSKSENLHRYYYNEYEEGTRKLKEYPVVIPAGTVLTVDRIYVRKGVKNYDSVSFILNKKTCQDEMIQRASGMIRFWVKLPEINGTAFQMERK